MSTTTTITKPAPVIEGSLTAFLKSVDKLGKGAVPSTFAGIDTSKFAPTIAAESQLQKDARAAASGLGALTGPQAYQPFMSPYQQEVIDTTLAEFDRNQAIQNTAMRDQAIAAGAYGGGREGVMAAESARGAAASRAQLQAQLLNQGFQQAQAAAAQDLAAQQGLGQYQQSMGQAGQAQQQAILDAAASAERESQFQPFTQLGLIGQQLAQIQPGAFPTQTVGYAPPAAPASPLATALGVGTGIASIGSKLGIFG
jgi:hypothetical protein|tara:strand:- start:2443 stop:3207 length:765 start_codon:yes stop_codon:yes gene_type:complete